jgi:hypothetical protein
MSTLRTELRRMLAQIATTRGAKDVLEQRVLLRRNVARVLQLAEARRRHENPHAGVGC